MINAIVPTSDLKELTMSSREIAELVEKRHDNVKRTIENLIEREIILPQIEEVKNHLGQTVKVYRLVERDSYIVVAQLSPEFTAKLVDRWRLLERAVGEIASQMVMRSEIEEMKASILALETAMRTRHKRVTLSKKERDINKIRKIIKKHGGKISHSDLLRHLSHSIRAFELKDLLAGLCVAGQVTRIEKTTKTKPSVSYKMVR